MPRFTIEKGTYTVVYKDPGDPPTDITLSSANLSENNPGAAIGILAVTDADDTEHTITVDDQRFEVVGDQLKLKDGISLNYEEEPTVDVGVTATDSQGNSYTEVFTIAVADLNDAPTADAVDLGAIEENGSRTITTSELLAGASDEDGDTLEITDLSIQDGGGALIDNTDGTWTYSPDADDDTDVRFAYTVSDGEFEATGTAETRHHTSVQFGRHQRPRVHRAQRRCHQHRRWQTIGCGRAGGDDTVNAGSGNDWVFTSWGDDLVIHVASENEGAWDYYAGGWGTDTLRLVVTQEIYDTQSFQDEVAKYQAKIDTYGSAWGYFHTLGVGFSSFEVIEVVVENGNEAPETHSTSASGLEDDVNPIPVVLSGTDADGTVASFTISTDPTNGALFADDQYTVALTTGSEVTAVGGIATVYFKPDANFKR